MSKRIVTKKKTISKLRGKVTIWAHSDAKWLGVGAIGLFSLLFSMLLAILDWFQSQPAPTAAWILAGMGIIMFTVSTVAIWHIQRRVHKYQQCRNERACVIRDQVTMGMNPARPYFVYLRPFGIDGKFVEAPRKGANHAYVEEYGWPTVSHDLESALGLLVHPYGDLVALSDDPGEAGAGHVRSTDLSWQKEVEALCEHAKGVFIVPFNFEGTAWEVEMLVRRGWLSKSLFVMPAIPVTRRLMGVRWFSRDYEALWAAGRRRYKALDLPEYNARGAVVRAGADRRVLYGFGRVPVFADSDDREQVEGDLETLHFWLAELSTHNEPLDQSPGRGL
jgi:hypothetical protein